MKAYAKTLAALWLALAPVAMAAPEAAWAEPHRQQGYRGEGRAMPGRPAFRAGPAGGYRGPAYGPAARAPAPYYAAPRYAPPRYAAPPPVYPPRGGYGYAPPPAYAGNSLGAGWGQQQDQARRGVRQGGLMPLGQVMAQVRRSTPGRLLDAGLESGPDGRPAYRLRWAAAGGRRIDFIVDAATGQIIGRSGY